MQRMIVLILFELKKILTRKKALLFLIALNVIPLVASIALIIAYLKFKSFGFGEVQFSMLYEIVQALFTGHIKLFSYIAPFFLALVVGDSFSTEFNKGYMKMLLITPVRRWQVISAKTIAVMLFLLLAVTIGGIFLQADLFVARAITQNSGAIPQQMLPDSLGNLDKPTHLVSSLAALQLLFMTFAGNLMLVGFFILFSLFFESAIIMSFTSLSVLMGLHTFYIIASNFLGKIDVWYTDLAAWVFSRHLSDLFSVSRIEGILEGKLSLFSSEVLSTLGSSFGWAALFYLLALAVFSRKQILH
ncbi:MAG: family transporter protein [Clostridiales bacterium]|nr:family transporter protein [Clostridiales bacterium]MDN5283128.1 family transporter protein [Candidatus Ozemobacter sp.]